jgi:putative peptidoglycan lipid II flippase
VLIKVFQPGFFAREDTRTPMLYAGVNMVLNVAGSIGLFFLFREWGFMPHVGIALATTVAGWVNALMLWGALLRRGHFIADARLARNLPLMLLASAAMGSVVYVAMTLGAPFLEPPAPFWVRIAALAALIGLGAAVYGLLILATGVMTLAQFRRYSRRQR